MYLKSSTGKTHWTSKTTGTRTGNRLVMNRNGNAYLYTATNAVIWATSTGKITSPAAAVLRVGKVLTRGHYRTRGQVAFGLDRHGNVVVTRFGRTVWSSHTAGRAGTKLALGKTGNLVLRTKHGRAIWTSHTKTSSARVVVTPAGDVQLQDARGKTHWRTKTGS